MAITSPFKKLSHSRENSKDESSSASPNRSQQHARKSSKNTNLPISQRTSQGAPSTNLHKKSNTVTSVNSTSSINSASLAQQYESDKQRLVKYCFSKHDPDGTLTESYITHVRLIEDSAYPSSKPPASSAPKNKKHRILVLAVLRDGTVRLHKGRENPNGSFQIGRTWSITELSTIVREPSSESGFAVKLGKNYYWETNSPRERQVFITSLVRIYRKFTKGFVPILINWDLSLFGLDEESYNTFVDKKWTERKQSTASTTSLPKPATQPQQQPVQESAKDVPAFQSPKRTTERSEYKSLSPPKKELKSFAEQKQNYTSDSSIPTLSSKRPSAQAPTVNPIDQSSRRPSEASSARKLSKPQLVPSATTNSSSSLSGKDPSLLPAFSTAQSHPPTTTSSSSSSSVPKQPIPPVPQIDAEPSTTGEFSDEITKQLDSMGLNDTTQRADIDETSLKKGISHDSSLLAPSSTESASRSLKNVEIVAHRKSMQEFEQEQDQSEDEEDDDDDITDMYQDAFEEESQDDSIQPEPFPEVEKQVTPDESYENSFDLNNHSEEQIHAVQTPATLTNHSDGEYDDLNELPETPHLQIPKARTRDARSNTVDSALSANIIPRLESESSSFDDIFDEINWETMDDSETLTIKLMKELADTEYETTKNLIELKSQSSTLGKFTSKINDECDKLSPLLNFFAVELSGFARDIQHVETESQGLQVETINKKTLWNDLQKLLNTVSVDENALRILLTANIDHDLNQIEPILADLQSAIVAIRGSDKFEEDLGDMKALRERRTKYENVLNEFLSKVKYDLDYRFNLAVKKIGDEEDSKSILKQLGCLMIYSGLTLFTKEVSSETFYELVAIYETSTNPLYQNIFTNLHKRLATSNQETFSLANANAFNASKVNSKPHKNSVESKQDRLRQRFGLLESHDTASNDSVSSIATSSSDNMAVFQIFDQIQRLVISQQDFLLKFFHLSNEDSTLKSYILKYPSEERSNLLNGTIHEVDFDRDNARDIYNSMSSIFQPTFDDLMKSVVQMLRSNQKITPSIIFYLEVLDKQIASTNQEFLMTIFKRLIDRLKIDWLKFIENQVKIIDKSVLAHRKVREVSIIIKNFTSFVSDIEKSLIELAHDNVDINTLGVRTIVNSSYEGLARAILKNLENEEDEKSFGRFKLHDDGDHKEKIDHTVNLIQNSNWLLESLSPYKIVTLEQSLSVLKKMYQESRDQYVSSLSHQNLAKIADFVNEVESLVNESSKSIDPSKKNAYNKNALNKILSSYTQSDIAKTVTHLRETVLKHFDDNSTDIQCQLIDKIWSALQGQFVSLTLRLYNITERYYRDVEPRFSKKDVIALFNAARV